MPKGKVAWTSVELSDGTRLWGYMDYFTVGQDLENRELSLKGPNLTSAAPNEAKVQDDYWDYFIVNGSDIRLLKIRRAAEMKHRFRIVRRQLHRAPQDAHRIGGPVER